MTFNIPTIIEELYLALYPAPEPNLWPEHLKNHPAQAHGLISFYRGLCLGLQLARFCFGGD